jgi:hypothetical protein
MSRRSIPAAPVVALFVSLLFSSNLAHAQYRTSIQGVVTDQTGAVIPGATLTLTNPGTGEKQIRTTDGNGVFNFNALPAAVPFRLEIEKDGFQKKEIDNLQLIPDQANAVNVQMEVGSIGQTVTVNAQTESVLDTETASVNGNVTSNQIQHMPTFGRDVTRLAQLAPGTFGDASQAGGNDNYNLPGTQSGGGQSGGADGIFKTENGVQVISNGNQTQNNGISIDGISTTSAVWGGSTVVTPSEDSVENVKIVANSYDAENGRFTGAHVEITSKSGTNNFHGSLFFTAHQPNLNAFQPYNGFGNAVLRDDNKFNQFGGSIGGPIWKNKVFFFFNYETVRQPNSNIPGNGWYDTPAFDALARPGSIAATYLSFPGNRVINNGINPQGDCRAAGLVEGVNCVTIPGQGINLGTPLTSPLGTQDFTWVSPSNPGVGSGLGTTADIANYLTSNPTTFTATQYNGRVDANVTPRDHLVYAMYWVPLSRTNFNGNRAYDLFHHDQINNAFSGIWNRTISPTFLNEARFNAAGWRWNEITSNPQSPVGLPMANIGTIGSITPNQFGPSVGSILNQWTYTWKDVATKILGPHTLKFGGELTRLFYLNENVFNSVPSYTFFNLWAFLNDAPHQENANFDPHSGLPTTERQDDRENIWGFFVQDDFKYRSNLTFNLGLRYSYFGPLYAKQNNMFRANPGPGGAYLTGLTVFRGNSWTPEKGNFGPELGFAWSPTRFNNRAVIRGGYGLNYNQNQIAISANIQGNPGLITSPTLLMSSPTSPNPGIVYATSTNLHSFLSFPPNPNTIVSFGPNGLPTTGTVNVFIFPGTLPTWRVHHFSLDSQIDLGHQVVATVGYQASISHNIYFNQSPNAVPATSGFTLNPQIGGGDYYSVRGRGNYNALLIDVKHNFARQFMADGQFTWGRSMDTSSGPYFEQPYPFNVDLQYGRSDYNVTRAFKVFGLWQPVFFHGAQGWVEKIVGDWSLSGIFNLHSGFPYTPLVNVTGGSLYCSTCGYTELFPGAYLGGAGTSTSNNAFKGPISANFPNGGTSYFTIPTFTAFSSGYGATLPQGPGVARNQLNQPGYKQLDVSVIKGFGFPDNKIVGENARLELRLDVFNLFNNLNFNPNSISNVITNSNFGTETAALTGRVLAIGALFSF